MDKGMEESILRPTCDARDQSLALGEAGGVDLADLLAKVKAAEQPDRKLDALIGVAVDRLTPHEDNAMWGVDKWVREELDGSETTGNSSAIIPRYTASLDAALRLLERALPGWRVKLSNVGDAWAYSELYRPGPLLTGRASGWVFANGGEAKTLPASVLTACVRTLIAQQTPT